MEIDHQSEAGITGESEVQCRITLPLGKLLWLS